MSDTTLTFDDGTELSKGDAFQATLAINGERTEVSLEILGGYRDDDSKLVVGQDGDALGYISAERPYGCWDDDCIGYVNQDVGDTLELYGLEVAN